jgi:hypothetical protein
MGLRPRSNGIREGFDEEFTGRTGVRCDGLSSTFVCSPGVLHDRCQCELTEKPQNYADERLPGPSGCPCKKTATSL